MSSDIIQLLPDSIANQIAAGEVVQRPASALKEMLENSIDAGASEITVVIKEAGKSLIQVVDNGKGMSLTDARMCFERHATSKIREFDDLQSIRTKGFRGEALASIAAVAQVQLRTRREEDELGTAIDIEASEVKKQEPIMTTVGTSISVRNLFYNVPARRNFLKSNPVEFRHITDEFHRVALAHPDVAFHLIHNDLDVYRLESGKLSRRIVQLFGKSYQQQMITCEEETPHLKISGYLGKPEFSRKTRGEQFFFVNNRYIRNAYLNHAVVTAFEGLLKEGYFPFYVLNIELDPAQVDVNVHPTKTEVKFQDERTLYGVIHSAVKQALGSFNVTPSLDFSTDINFMQVTAHRESREKGSERAYSNYSNVKPSQTQIENWEKIYSEANKEEEKAMEQALKELKPDESKTITSGASVSIEKNYRLHDNYLVRQVKTGMMVLDKEAALERICYENLETSTKGGTQACLFPQQISLNPSDMNLVMELRSEIMDLGFEFELMGERTIIIQGIPADIAPCNEREVFEGILEQYKQQSNELKLSSDQKLRRALAKRMAVSRCKQMNDLETDQLIEQLFGCEQPNYTPGGKPTYVLISLEQIKSWFTK